MHRQPMTVPSLLFCATLLTGCEWAGMATRPPTVLTQIQVERPQVNLADLHCPQRPPPPKSGTQRDVAIYLLEVAAWMDTCQAKLAEMREILRPSQEVTQ